MYRRYAMTFEWEPNKEYLDVYAKNMMVDTRYLTDEVMGNFKAYWVAQGDPYNDAQWIVKLLNYVKGQVARGYLQLPKNTVKIEKKEEVKENYAPISKEKQEEMLAGIKKILKK